MRRSSPTESGAAQQPPPISLTKLPRKRKPESEERKEKRRATQRATYWREKYEAAAATTQTFKLVKTRPTACDLLLKELAPRIMLDEKTPLFPGPLSSSSYDP